MFTISGPELFCRAVLRVLDELQAKAPERYQEAVTDLPKAHYDPDAVHALYPNAGAHSGGEFAVDGTGSYEGFRRLFLHEVGHNVARRERGDRSEEAAEAYAQQVAGELQRWDEHTTAKTAAALRSIREVASFPGPLPRNPEEWLEERSAIARELLSQTYHQRS
jgi:hypothetical protein